MKIKAFISALLFTVFSVLTALAQIVQIIPFIMQVAGRADWAKAGIVYDHLNLNTYYSVSFIRPDGTGYKDLTKNKAGCPQKNNGQPAFDPFGRYVVFQAEKDVNFDPADVHYGPSFLSTPGAGINCDLWVLDLQNSVFTRLTNLPTKKTLSDTTKYSGVLHPQFSNNGKKLLWGECIDGASGNGYGFWRMNISDLDTSGGVPHLMNTVPYDSGGVLGDFTFLETSGSFSPNDSVVTYCANAIKGQPVNQLDIFTFNFYTQQLINLTPDSAEYDEHSHFNGNGSRVLWMTGRGMPFDSTEAVPAKTDFWVMNSDGTGKTRATFFNDSASQDYKNFTMKGHIIASDNVWSPFGGDTALCYLQVYDSTGGYHQQLVFISIPSQITEVTSEKSGDEITIFPNPTISSVLNISSPQNNTPDKICIFDLTGRNVAEYSFSNKINIAQLKPGIYFLKITDRTALVHLCKLIVP